MNRNVKRKIKEGKAYVFDLETTHADIHGIEHKTKPKPFLFGLKRIGTKQYLLARTNEEVSKVVNVLQDKSNVIVCHNAKFEKEIMHLCGVTIKAKVYDTMLMMKVHRPDIAGQNYALDRVTKLLFYKTSPWSEKLDKWVKEEKRRRKLKINKEQYLTEYSRTVKYNEIPKEIIDPYNKEDLNHTEMIFLYLIDHVDLNETPCKLLHQLIDPIREMERRGVKLDVEYLEYCKKEMKVVLNELQLESKRIASNPNFNINSPQHIGEFLGKRGILKQETPSSRRNSTGKVIYATGADILEQFEGKHPLVDLKLKYSKYSSLYTRYISKLGNRLDKDNALHTNIHTERAITFRLSTSKPSTQQFPKRRDLDEFSIRKLFIPRNGFMFGDFDYSQIEYRLFAHYANIESLIEEYRKNPNADYHSMTCRMMGLSEEERDLGKTINFMLIYGGGIAKLALKLRISVQKAQEYWNAYMEAIPEYKPFANKIMNEIRVFGGISDVFGHRYSCPPQFAYKGINYLIQGTAAQIMKISIVEVSKYLKSIKAKSRVLWTIHDELLIEVHKSEYNLFPEIKSIMENFNQFRVPIVVDAEVAEKNWKDRIDYDKWKSSQC